jgi:hypothetical protein
MVVSEWDQYPLLRNPIFNPLELYLHTMIGPTQTLVFL